MTPPTNSDMLEAQVNSMNVSMLVAKAEAMILHPSLVNSMFAGLTNSEQKWIILYVLASQLPYTQLQPLLDRTYLKSVV